MLCLHNMTLRGREAFPTVVKCCRHTCHYHTCLVCSGRGGDANTCIHWWSVHFPVVEENLYQWVVEKRQNGFTVICQIYTLPSPETGVIYVCCESAQTLPSTCTRISYFRSNMKLFEGVDLYVGNLYMSIYGEFLVIVIFLFSHNQFSIFCHSF